MIIKYTTTSDFEHPGADLGQAETCGGVEPDNGIPTLPSCKLYIQPDFVHVLQ